MFSRSLALACFFAITTSISAEVVSREEALKAGFPGAKIQTSMIFLDEVEMKEAARLSGTKIETPMVARYEAIVDGKQVGRAYLDTHVVRTKKESLLILLNADGTVKRIEMVAFLEPHDYIPPDKWYEQFEKKRLNENLRLKKDIPAVTGATLTSQATTDAVRRILAIDQILQQKLQKAAKQ
jgi:electron transport complex protein RnfG